MKEIKETIVVEGRDDVSRLRSCLRAHIIVTQGFVLSEETLAEIAYAVERTGVIVLTDPDGVGERIRARISKRIPGVKHAFITKEEGRDGDDIGVENASCAVILDALSRVRTLAQEPAAYTPADLVALGCSGHPEAAMRRNALGRQLGIGYANARGFLKRLNHYGITEEELGEALGELGWTR